MERTVVKVPPWSPGCGVGEARRGRRGWTSRASGFLPWSAPLGFLLADQEAAAAEDQEQRRHEDYRRERVDDGAHAELDHGVDLERQRARPDPAHEVRDHEVVERERERQQAARHYAR